MLACENGDTLPSPPGGAGVYPITDFSGGRRHTIRAQAHNQAASLRVIVPLRR
jgi:hypothetical protein